MFDSDSGWCSEHCDPPADECLGLCFGCDVDYRDRLGPTGEPVDTCHKVSIPIRRRERTNWVDVDVAEAGVRSESAQWCHGVAMYLGSLAFETSSGPLSDISVHIGPHRTCANEFQGGSYAWV